MKPTTFESEVEKIFERTKNNIIGYATEYELDSSESKIIENHLGLLKSDILSLIQTTIRESLLEKVKQLIDKLDFRGLAEAFRERDIDWHEQEWKEFIELIQKKERQRIQTTIKECMPEREDEGGRQSKEEPNTWYQDDPYNLGWNACLDTITSNLNKGGLIRK